MHSFLVKKMLLLFVIFTLSGQLFFPISSVAEPFNPSKVLAVMSYNRGNTWQDEQRAGIDSVLAGINIKYFYLDTKRNKAGGKAKAEEAFRIYQSFNPDAVISADDNAQSLFVVPYLKDKVKTPVFFLGVNNDASKYGFPASNVTGILEVKHIGASISFAQLLVNDLKKIAVLYTDNRSNQLNIEQLKKEQAGYTAEITKFIKLETLADAIETIDSAGNEVDAFFALHLTGLLGKGGTPVDATVAMESLSPLSKIPIIGANSFDIESGALCGVIQTGEEQGATAAQMVLDYFNGKPISEIPITQNRNGKRIINVTTAERLGVMIPPAALRGTELVQ